MKLITKQNSIERKNSALCIVTEYEVGNKKIDFALAKLLGRYPDSGRVTNALCSEVVYVHEGSGKVVVNDQEYQLNAGDAVLIEAGEKFYWDGHLSLFISCHPAFTIEQHVTVD